ncbi:hypothetical protein HMPREF9374_1916 [Desmospora sp. 8437]|nr:hypothetical protein HMPREF9374_1916 [Desmospora sp. 8437]
MLLYQMKGEGGLLLICLGVPLQSLSCSGWWFFCAGHVTK